MIIIVYENPLNIVNSVYTEFCDKYPKSCVYRLGNRPGAQEIEMLSHAPLLMHGWLILCSSNVSRRTAGELENCNSANVLLVQCSSGTELLHVQEELAAMEYRVIDNHRVEKSVMVQWIDEQTGCGYDSAQYLYNRLGGNLRDVVSNVSVLQSVPEIDKKTIRKYAQKGLKASVGDIVPYLLGVQRQGIQEKDIMMVVHRFQYAFSWLLTEIRKQISDYLLVFDAISCGELDIRNYLQHRELSKSKRIRAMSPGKLKYVVQLFGQVSVERICFVKLQLDMITAGRFGLAKLVYLIKIGG